MRGGSNGRVHIRFSSDALPREGRRELYLFSMTNATTLTAASQTVSESHTPYILNRKASSSDSGTTSATPRKIDIKRLIFGRSLEEKYEAQRIFIPEKNIEVK